MRCCWWCILFMHHSLLIVTRRCENEIPLHNKNTENGNLNWMKVHHHYSLVLSLQSHVSPLFFPGSISPHTRPSIAMLRIWHGKNLWTMGKFWDSFQLNNFSHLFTFIPEKRRIRSKQGNEKGFERLKNEEGKRIYCNKWLWLLPWKV